MKLIFKNSQGKERVVANHKNEQEAIDEMRKFCEDRNFTIYYIRSWEHDGRKIFDVGSWSEFFCVEKD